MSSTDEAKADLMRVLDDARGVLERSEWHVVGDQIGALVGGVQGLMKAYVGPSHTPAQVEKMSWWDVIEETKEMHNSLAADRGTLRALNDMYKRSNPRKHGTALACESSLIHLCRAFNAVVTVAHVVGGLQADSFPVDQVIRPLRRPSVPAGGESGTSLYHQSIELDTFGLWALRSAYVAYYRQVSWQVARALEDRTGQWPDFPPLPSDVEYDLPAEVESLARMAWGDDETQWDTFSRAQLRKAQAALLAGEGISLGQDETLGWEDPDKHRGRWMADDVMRMIGALRDIELMVILLDEPGADGDQPTG